LNELGNYYKHTKVNAAVVFKLFFLSATTNHAFSARTNLGMPKNMIEKCVPCRGFEINMLYNDEVSKIENDS
jgi:hypothetical protein